MVKPPHASNVIQQWRWNSFNDDEVLVATAILVMFIIFFVFVVIKKLKFCCQSDDEGDAMTTIPYRSSLDVEKGNQYEQVLSLSESDKETASLREYDFGRFNQEENGLKSVMKKVDKIKKEDKTKKPSRMKKRVSLNLDAESQDTSTITESTIASTETSSVASYHQSHVVLPPLSPPSYANEPATSFVHPIPRISNTTTTTTVTERSTQKDPRLVKTLLSVLGQGILITKYSPKSSKQIHLSLVGTELRWRTVKMFAKHGKHIDIREVNVVSTGKQTNTFHLQLSRGALEDHCFSLILNRTNDTLDLECKSKVERDALAQGFSILIQRYQHPNRLLGNVANEYQQSSTISSSPFAATVGGNETHL